MLRSHHLHDLIAFIAVARERSFTRAAAQLGISASTLSHTVRTLEERLGVRLLTRTTRSVSVTDAGDQLLASVAPHFEEIDAGIAAVGELRDKPAGTIRITTTDYAARTILWPKLSKMLASHPDIKVEIVIDYGLSDIVAERYDIGVRSGDQVARDMIAVRVGPDQKMAVVGSPAYLRKHPPPASPQQLTEHNCINLRLPTHGGLLPWELKKGRKTVQVRVEGQLTFGGTYQMLDAALAGHGLAYVPADIALPHVERRQLAWVLEDWFPNLPGQHAYYPSRRQSSRALTVVIDALRHRA